MAHSIRKKLSTFVTPAFLSIVDFSFDQRSQYKAEGDECSVFGSLDGHIEMCRTEALDRFLPLCGFSLASYLVPCETSEYLIILPFVIIEKKTMFSAILCREICAWSGAFS